MHAASAVAHLRRPLRAEMTRGERAIVRARPEYGYAHPDCGMARPPGATADAQLSFDLQLLNWWGSVRCAPLTSA